MTSICRFALDGRDDGDRQRRIGLNDEQDRASGARGLPRGSLFRTSRASEWRGWTPQHESDRCSSLRRHRYGRLWLRPSQYGERYLWFESISLRHELSIWYYIWMWLRWGRIIASFLRLVADAFLSFAPQPRLSLNSPPDRRQDRALRWASCAPSFRTQSDLQFAQCAQQTLRPDHAVFQKSELPRSGAAGFSGAATMGAQFAGAGQQRWSDRHSKDRGILRYQRSHESGAPIARPSNWIRRYHKQESLESCQAVRLFHRWP